MADVAKQIEEHLRRRYNRGPGEPNFAKCLSVSDKFEAHGLGVLIEELMSTAELIEYRRKKATTAVCGEQDDVAVAFSFSSSTRAN
jgi:hypothetical protein